MALRHLYNTRLYIELGIANIYKYFSIMQYLVVNILKIILKHKKRGAKWLPFNIFVNKY